MARGEIPVGWPEKCAAFAAEIRVMLGARGGGMADCSVLTGGRTDCAPEPRSYSHWGMFYG